MQPKLPSGTVTFVFTDVEGSTSLLSELGAEKYADALAAHRTAIRDASTAKGGVEVDTQGDASFFAFPSAPDALAAASDFTARLEDEGPIRVRVGIHTGTPLVGDEGYVGHDVHRAARIAAAGHGGQVLVSASTASLIESELIDLGEHRFKDLRAAERVYQLGTNDFPDLKSLYRAHLPVPATSFLGRERELRDVTELITRADTRLVTLTGPGGAGKTRLSVQAAAEAAEGFPYGVFWVPLAPLREGAVVEEAFARALDVKERPGVPLERAIEQSLTGKRLLVVVDNCEHLIERVASFLSRFLDACPTVVVMASSRERLRVHAERLYDVPPMDGGDAEELFVARAAAARSDFRPDGNVAAICEALDGLPLAIELAAARVRSLSPEAIRGRLDERLALLASRTRDVDERQRTLEATIAWSYELLSEDEQRSLRALSVFAGGCTLAAGEAVAEADLDSVESLLDKSLIRHRIDEAGHDRYWLLETIREYAQRELERLGEADEAQARHTEFFLEAASGLLAPVSVATSDEQQTEFRCDRANYLEAISRAIAGGDGGSAQRFVRRLGRVMFVTGSGPRVLYDLGRASLALAGGTEADRAYASVRAASCAYVLGEYEAARELLSEADALFDTIGDAMGTADAVAWRAAVDMAAGDFENAVALAERLSGIGEALGDRRIASHGEDLLGGALLGRGLAEGNRDAAERSLSLALAAYELEATADSSFATAAALINVAWSLYACGEFADSLTTAQRGLKSLVELDVAFLPESLELIGLLAVSTGNNDVAATLLTVARSRREEEEMVPELWLRQLLARSNESVIAALGDGGYKAAVRAGEALSYDEAIELALAITAE